ncbi:unnamed protein product [Rotaria magnacalcarata]|uniref:Phthiocerol/phthiodiolone dimycocerosyl transferase C-terminal domain-containing protein n=1 Tax=Rotaria magnacalcarata TaxID=392030 RepID=A0A816CBW1_9BILA|nr:unnamed protein product [Rotaria magnacalcarata]CAF1619384.1 unnamed protein product [Rotaria magnacalcarata]CAF2243292.1 unnamed protein product [Rotaria magnacalcarata]CAF3759056.1 unnamed protein product [Rotaria magnacalcarata]CAF3872652.1 unnamed protein product [Rotaria magnacalcarata]
MFSWFQPNSTPAVNKKQRLLGSAENALMHASQQHQGYTKVGEVLHLQGPYISVETLSAAISLLQRRHPVLRSRLQINPEKPDSFLLEEDDTLKLNIRVIPRKHDDHLIFWRQEWRQQEKKITNIGQGLAEFWLLQDPEDDNDDNSPREIIIICEHSVCDGISLSSVANELLIALAGQNDNIFANSLDWPITMEAAIQRSLSIVGRMIALGKFIFTTFYMRLTNTQSIARIPLGNVDFPLTDMCDFCHTESCYAMLNKEETQMLVEKCRSEGVTVTSAVSSAVLCAASTLVKSEEDHPTALRFSIGADTRRRCVPPISNHDLSYHVSGIMPFILSIRDIPTTSKDMWQLATVIGDFIKTSVDAGQILALGLIMGRIFQKTLGPPDFSVLPTSAISSWGVLPFSEDYGRWKLVEMTPFVNMILGAMPLTILQNVNGILTIMQIGADPLVPKNILESFCDGTMQKLHQMIEA